MLRLLPLLQLPLTHSVLHHSRHLTLKPKTLILAKLIRLKGYKKCWKKLNPKKPQFFRGSHPIAQAIDLETNTGIVLICSAAVTGEIFVAEEQLKGNQCALDANDQSSLTNDPLIVPPTAQPQQATPIPDSTQSVTMEPTQPLNLDVFSAKCLIAVRTRNRQKQYLVKCAGYPASCNTWGPGENIFDHALIENFEKRQNIKRTSRVSTFSPISTGPFSPASRLPLWIAILLFLFMFLSQPPHPW